MGWSGGAYDGVADPQAAAGAEVLHRVDPPLGATVVDAGCGSGRVTEVLLDRRPDITVVGLDASPSMLAAAGDRPARFGARVVLREADLSEAWPLGPDPPTAEAPNGGRPGRLGLGPEPAGR